MSDEVTMGERLGELFKPLLNEEEPKQDEIDALLEENKEALSDIALRYIARNDGILERLAFVRLVGLFSKQGIPVYREFVYGLLSHLMGEDLITMPKIEYANGGIDYFFQLTPKANLREDVKEIKSEIKHEKDKKTVESALGITKGYGLVPKASSADELIPLIGEEGYLRIPTGEGVELLYQTHGETPSLKKIKITDA